MKEPHKLYSGLVKLKWAKKLISGEIRIIWPERFIYSFFVKPGFLYIINFKASLFQTSALHISSKNLNLARPGKPHTQPYYPYLHMEVALTKEEWMHTTDFLSFFTGETAFVNWCLFSCAKVPSKEGSNSKKKKKSAHCERLLSSKSRPLINTCKEGNIFSRAVAHVSTTYSLWI